MAHFQSDNLSFRHVFRGSDLIGKIALILSSWFGAGLFPVVPGTFGTLAAVPFIFVFDDIADYYKVLFLFLVIAAAIWASGRAEESLRVEDPSEVVIDEVAGFFLAVFFLPFSLTVLAMGFVLFRFFDILKPYPIKKLERIKGGLGIVGDDLLAGFYTYVSLRIILFFMK